MAILPRLAIALPLGLPRVQRQFPVATFAALIVASSCILKEESQRQVVPYRALPVGSAHFIIQEVVLDPVVHLLQRHPSILHQTDANQVRVIEWRLLLSVVLVEQLVTFVFFLASEKEVN